MAAKIRLARTGRKKIARFRIVVADSRKSRDGRFIETLGYYNPQRNPKEFEMNVPRIGYWLKQGVQVSLTVQNLFDQDHIAQKVEALQKGLPPETLALERDPERKRKPKPKREKAKATA